MSSTAFHFSETTLALFTSLATPPIARGPIFFFFKELVGDGKITLRHIPTQNQVAYIATKYLLRTTIKYLGLIKEFAA